MRGVSMPARSRRKRYSLQRNGMNRAYRAWIFIKLTATRRLSLLIRDDETNELAFVVVHGDIRRELQGYRIGGDVGIAGWVATNREPVVVNKPRQDRRFSPQVDEAFSFVTQSLLCVPMATRNNLIGVIQLVNKKNGGEFTDADIALLSILGHVAAMALEDIHQHLEAEEEAAIRSILAT